MIGREMISRHRYRISCLFLLAVFFFLHACGGPSETVKKPVPGHQRTKPVPSQERRDRNPAALAFYPIQCRGRQKDVALPLKQITSRLEAQAIPYNSIPLSDCSGMFHRVLLMLDSTCPGNAFPSHKQYRSTRQLAQWYHLRGSLVLVHDALSSSDLIKPGAVMFFGKRGRHYKNFTANDLFLRSRGIEHMGVVVDVQKDRKGRVVSYRMFHGRKTGSIAKVTLHKRQYSSKSYPAYGNGSQQWVAMARIVN